MNLVFDFSLFCFFYLKHTLKKQLAFILPTNTVFFDFKETEASN